MLNALSFDIEEWFQVTSFESVVKPSEWDRYESRVVGETVTILQILQKYNTKATFFVLGYVAEKYPDIVRDISDNGHELAIHGYSHKLVCNMSPKEFEEEIVKSRDIVEQITGREVIGYRAPSYSITDESRWAFDILENYGFRYDSSIIPGGIRFGISGARRFPYIISEKGSLIEFPVSTMKMMGRMIPFSGGLFLRVLPYCIIKLAIKRINKLGHPAMIYLHPWELDVNHPRISVTAKNRFIHYFNLKSTENKLKALLNDFECGTINNVLLTQNMLG